MNRIIIKQRTIIEAKLVQNLLRRRKGHGAVHGRCYQESCDLSTVETEFPAPCQRTSRDERHKCSGRNT